MRYSENRVYEIGEAKCDRCGCDLTRDDPLELFPMVVLTKRTYDGRDEDGVDYCDTRAVAKVKHLCRFCMMRELGVRY
jgi:hypothetical protein